MIHDTQETFDNNITVVSFSFYDFHRSLGKKIFEPRFTFISLYPIKQYTKTNIYKIPFARKCQTGSVTN